MKNYLRNYFIRLKNHAGLRFAIVIALFFFAYSYLTKPLADSIALGMFCSSPIWLAVLISEFFD
jgi:hypothetical protein